MNFSAVIGAGFFVAVAAQNAMAQSLPEFDENDFEILSLQGNSSALVRSDGRDFVCAVEANYEAGYMRIQYCLPFALQSEAYEQDRYVAGLAAKQAEQDAIIAAQIAEKAAVEAAKLAKDRQESESKQAIEMAEREEEKRVALALVTEKVAKITKKEMQGYLVDALRANGCELTIDNAAFDNAVGFAAVVNAAALPSSLEAAPRDQFRKLALSAMGTLYRDKKLSFTDDATKIKLLECN